MSDSFIILDEPAVTDKKLDAENVDGGTPPLMRERIQVTGAALAEVAAVKNAAPTTEYGLIARALIYPPTTGGCSNFHLVAAGSGDANNVKASAGQLFGVRVFNKANVPIYVKFHNTAGTPTAGAGVVKTIGCQAGMSRDVPIPLGHAFATGIGISIVTGIADNDATAVSASDCVVDIEYK